MSSSSSTSSTSPSSTFDPSHYITDYPVHKITPTFVQEEVNILLSKSLTYQNNLPTYILNNMEYILKQINELSSNNNKINNFYLHLFYVLSKYLRSLKIKNIEKNNNNWILLYEHVSIFFHSFILSLSSLFFLLSSFSFSFLSLLSLSLSSLSFSLFSFFSRFFLSSLSLFFLLFSFFSRFFLSFLSFSLFFPLPSIPFSFSSLTFSSSSFCLYISTFFFLFLSII